jgi:hypothetical protein
MAPAMAAPYGRPADDVHGDAQIADGPPDPDMGHAEGPAARKHHADRAPGQEARKPRDVLAILRQGHMVVQEDRPRCQPMGRAARALHPVRMDQHQPPLGRRDQLERKLLQRGRRRLPQGLRHEDGVVGLVQHGARPGIRLGPGGEKDGLRLPFLRVEPGQRRVAVRIGILAHGASERLFGD